MVRFATQLGFSYKVLTDRMASVHPGCVMCSGNLLWRSKIENGWFIIENPI